MDFVVFKGALYHRPSSAIGLGEGEIGVGLTRRAEDMHGVSGTNMAGKSLAILLLVDGHLDHAQLKRIVLRHPVRVI